MFFTERVKRFIESSLETLGSTVDSVAYRMELAEKDLVQYHNEHEEEIRQLKLENQQLRQDFDCLLAQLEKKIETRPAQPEVRRIVTTRQPPV